MHITVEKIHTLSSWLNHVNLKQIANDVLRETDEKLIRSYAALVVIKASGADRLRAVEQFIDIGFL